MPKIPSRRTVTFGSLLLLGAPALAAPQAKPAAKPAAAPAGDPNARLADLERRSGGRLGVAALDLATGDRLAHRSEERFALCSTFKLLAAAQILARVDRGDEMLDRRIEFNARDVVPNSPVTTQKADRGGLTLEEICVAAITVSDGTAGNLMLQSLGGPEGLTTWLRQGGDEFTRLDRTEPDLADNRGGDPRDTTTPLAMVGTLNRILVGTALSAPSRERLTRWLMASKTGDRRLRAGFPKDWKMAAKTGTGANGATNHAGIVWPPDRAPILVAAYYSESKAPPAAREAVLAEVGRIVAAAVAPR